MKRFVNSFVIVTVILLILLPLVAVPVTATITNEGVKQLTKEPWDQKSFSCRQYAFSWNIKGGVYHSLKEYRGAIECFDKALEIDHKLGDVWNNKGATYYELGKYQKAIDCFDRALKIAANDAAAWNNKGNALRENNLETKAEKCYDKVKQLGGEVDSSVSLTFTSMYKKGIA